MNIELAPSPNHSSRGGAIPSMIVLHATAGSYASSLAWLRNPQPQNPENRVSTHYLISKAGHIAQLVADNQAAWHAGRSSWRGRNAEEIQAQSIGIELENANDGIDKYPTVQLIAAQELCRIMIGMYGIQRADLTRHLDIATPKGRKTDPAGFPWLAFVEACYLSPARPPAPISAPAAHHSYIVLGLPVYERADRTGALWGYLLSGESVEIEDERSGHLADGRGFVDVAGAIRKL